MLDPGHSVTQNKLRSDEVIEDRVSSIQHLINSRYFSKLQPLYSSV
jgi:hypothetical protein